MLNVLYFAGLRESLGKSGESLALPAQATVNGLVAELRSRDEIWAAALAAGNPVLAKPAEQTPGLAGEAVKLLHAAGVPEDVLQIAHGPGETVGAALVAAPGVAGVVFTGSTQVAKIINRALAAKEGPITPLIAETGGINAMLVDSSALPEQVADAVRRSSLVSPVTPSITSPCWPGSCTGAMMRSASFA